MPLGLRLASPFMHRAAAPLLAAAALRARFGESQCLRPVMDRLAEGEERQDLAHALTMPVPLCTQQPKPSEQHTTTHPDQHAGLFLPDDKGSVWLFAAKDSGESFTDISGNLPEVPVTAILKHGEQLIVGAGVVACPADFPAFFRPMSQQGDGPIMGRRLFFSGSRQRDRFPCTTKH